MSRKTILQLLSKLQKNGLKCFGCTVLLYFLFALETSKISSYKILRFSPSWDQIYMKS